MNRPDQQKPTVAHASTAGDAAADNAGGAARVSLIQRFQWLFAPVAVSFLLYVAWKAHADILRIFSEASFGLLLMATGFWLCMHAIAPLFAVSILRTGDGGLDYRTAAKVHLSSLPARYVPGGVWHSVSRVLQLRQQGIAAGDLAVFVFLENVLALFLACLLGIIFLLVSNDIDQLTVLLVGAGIACLVVLLAVPRVLRSKLLNNGRTVPPGSYFTAILIVAFSWCIAAASFVCFHESLASGFAGQSVLSVAGTYLLAWAAGFAAFFAPQGIGVFEYVAAELLRDGRSIGTTAVLVAGFRVVILVADVIAWVLFRLLHKKL